MDYIFYSVAIFAIGVFVIFAVINLLIFISSSYYGSERHVSMLPLVGGVSGCIGFALIPSLRYYAWLPLLLDASVLSLFFVLPTLAYQAWEVCSFNLAAEYVGFDAERNVTIRLFTTQAFTLEYKVNRDFEKFRFSEFHSVGNGWLENEVTLELKTEKQFLIFEKTYAANKNQIRLISGDEKFLDGLPLIKTQE